MQHHDTPPFLLIISSPLIGAVMALGRETVARLLAYVGADYLLAKVVRHEEQTHPQVRAAIDKFLDD